tara:strand:+ start:344 stop:526 length:183 start_codon:yes stop_codon:yes gene_type:complete
MKDANNSREKNREVTNVKRKTKVKQKRTGKVREVEVIHFEKRKDTINVVVQTPLGPIRLL